MNPGQKHLEETFLATLNPATTKAAELHLHEVCVQMQLHIAVSIRLTYRTAPAVGDATRIFDNTYAALEPPECYSARVASRYDLSGTTQTEVLLFYRLVYVLVQCFSEVVNCSLHAGATYFKNHIYRYWETPLDKEKGDRYEVCCATADSAQRILCLQIDLLPPQIPANEKQVARDNIVELVCKAPMRVKYAIVAFRPWKIHTACI